MAVRYVVRQKIGQGGMGQVHLATMVTPAGERAVAVKWILPQGQSNAEERASLLKEAQIAFRLRHSNICQVLDVGEGEAGTFLVMEHVPGMDLRTLLEHQARRQLDVACAIYVAREVALALDYAHRQTGAGGASLGILHGDVTPPNILLSEEGEVKLADFGVARALGEEWTTRCGTPGYMAPEIRSERIDHRADQYSLAMTLYTALSGEWLGGGRPELELLPRKNGGVSSELLSIIRRAGAERPDARFLSAAELARALSLELARRCAEFLPPMLGALVRQASAAREPPLEEEEKTTLYSVTESREVARPAALQAKVQSTQTLAKESPQRARWLMPAALLALSIVAGAFWFRAHQVRSPAPLPSAQQVVAQPTTLPLDAAPVAHSAPPPPPSTTAQAASVEPPKAKPQTGYLTVISKDWGAVFVDGRRVGEETPLYRHALSSGTHRVWVQYAHGGRSTVQRVHIATGREATVHLGGAP